MSQSFLTHLSESLGEITNQGLRKVERPISGAQGARIDVDLHGARSGIVNLCANNYLGLANHPALVSAAKEAMDDAGYGMASVRFICGTQTLHQRLESRSRGSKG